MGAAALVDRPRRHAAAVGVPAGRVDRIRRPGAAVRDRPRQRLAGRRRGRGARRTRAARRTRIEIYKRLPNDTDFSILKRQDIPGLNFAPVGDSYAYHTARDTPERLSLGTIRDTGENVVADPQRAERDRHHAALDRHRARTSTSAEPSASSTGRWPAGSSSIAALVLGVVAWVRVTAAAVRIAGLLRWLLTLVWSAAGAVAAFAAMTAATWALRSGARRCITPWYAHPDRLFVLLLAVGVLAAWTVSRAGRWLPARAHGLRHPLVAWSVALPVVDRAGGGRAVRWRRRPRSSGRFRCSPPALLLSVVRPSSERGRARRLDRRVRRRGDALAAGHGGAAAVSRRHARAGCRS